MILPAPREKLDQRSLEHLDRLKNGCFLLSREELQDPNFTGALVLICAFSDDGAYGLVINRPSTMPLSEIFESEVVHRPGKKKVYIGGPVRQEVLQVLLISETKPENGLEIAPRVFLGGDWEDLGDVLDANESTTRLFLGYSGWAPGQLETEIVAGAWDVYNIDVNRVMVNPELFVKGSYKELQTILNQMV